MLKVMERGSRSARQGARPYGDVLLQLDVFPETSSADQVEAAVDAAARLGDRVCAVVNPLTLTLRPHPVLDRLIGLAELGHEEERRAHAAAETVLAGFAAAARRRGLEPHSLVVHAPVPEFPRLLAEIARTWDLCLIPYADPVDGQRALAFAVAFGSGRPLIVWPEGASPAPDPARVLIAWDGGRAAARAVGDAWPLLQGAREILVATVAGASPPPPHKTSAPLLAHLARHGLSARTVEAKAAEESAEAGLRDILRREGAGLLVMGAYGRRGPAREMVFGGVTANMLVAPPVPIFLSH